MTPFLQTLTNLAGFRLASAYGLLLGRSMVWGLPLLVALAAWWADSHRIKKVFTV
jgi:hypothetical protein